MLRCLLVLTSAASTAAFGRTAGRRALTTMAALPAHLQQVKADLAAGAQLLDVREPYEYGAGRLKCASNVPLSELQRGLMPDVAPETKLYLHCAAGIRVHPAATLLKMLGYDDVTPLREGYAELSSLKF
ncbi:Rhodanese-like domain-containing protein [Pelagophyceae sp. CCMP2097]|nr:Rhodanese-like domain-containing protein [Pelagophyceae sp. CCMP2097]|mmetsp:Transcript_9455/g.31259  ORF Transcript_9455/g.31259 Transcript_9455/m.31259 type:complete len:129 (-) Transcript_9455:28-414(-)